MPTQDSEFLELLRATFKVEAAEHLQAMVAGLLQLEQASAPEARRGIVETVFRAAHSLKGAARAVDFSQVETLCESLEDAFAAWKRQGKAPPQAALDQLHTTLDTITAVLAAPTPADAARPAAEPLFVPVPFVPAPFVSAAVGVSSAAAADEAADLAPDMSAAPSADQAALPPLATPWAPAAEETVRIAVAKLDAHLSHAEEMLSVKLGAGQRADELRGLAQRLAAWNTGCAAMEPEVRALRQALGRPADGAAWPTQSVGRLLAFVDWNLGRLKTFESALDTLVRSADEDRQQVGKLVQDLLEDSKRLLLLPFSSLAAPFPKLVRDLCRDEGKEAELHIQGDAVQIDKRILEQMKDPLIHLLRNCIAHGIEAPAQRRRLGKPPRATITLAVSRVDGRMVQVLLADDGAGIDTAAVRAAAVQRGLLSAQAAAQLSEAETQALIFQSEVSTSPVITQLSGRGLGLAIVREKAEMLGGEVSVESHAGVGTAFRIRIPALRATFRGLLVEAAGRQLVLPTAQVERVSRVRPDDIGSVKGRATIALAGRTLPLVRLADVLELPAPSFEDAPVGGTPIMVLGSGDERVAFAVDAVLDEHEVLVKPLARPLARVRNVAGATILGSGRVAPVLNVSDLLKSARRLADAPARVAASTRPVPTQVRAVLVAEDSITSRMLIKNILESAGYRVSTAVDGMEAYTLLRAEAFDLLVSDVEMPRLNGFDLTARVRADPKLGELPVVLVSALETALDRERGIDAGANAYIVKSSFDQSNLLEAVRRLI